MPIKRPAAVRGVIHAHEIQRFQRETELVVEEGECAIFARDGRGIGLLLAGRHRLGPEAVPFLIDACDPDGAISARIFFVPLEAVPGVPVRGRLGRVSGPEAPSFALVMRTLVTIRIDDPFRVGTILASLPEGRTFDDLIESTLSPRLHDLVSQMASSGEAPIGTVGGAALGALKEALHQGALSLDDIGVHVVDVTSLELRPDSLACPPPSLTPHGDAIRWGLEGIPFRDASSGNQIAVTAHGSFESPPVPDHLHDWVRGLITEAIHSSAASYTGSVIELPLRIDEWSQWLTIAVSPAIERETGVRGRVTVGGIGLPPG